MKICKECAIEQEDINYRFKLYTRKDGTICKYLNSVCKTCANIKAKNRSYIYYKKNSSKINSLAKKKYKECGGKEKARIKYKKNKIDLNIWYKKWREKNKEKVNKRNSKYKKSHREIIKSQRKRWMIRQRNELGKFYLKELLSQSGISRKNITSELLELKRLQISGKRLIEHLKQKHENRSTNERY